jgi:hypothetical protein
MRRTTRLLSLFALVGGLFVSSWGTGTSSAQAHHDDHGGHDDPPPSSTTSTPVESQPGAQMSEIRYGPFGIPAARGNTGDHHDMGMTGNQFRFFIQKPCSNCYITDIQADLVDASGRQLGFNTGQMLHHMVLASWTGRQDATCWLGFPFPLGIMFGQRFFASGDERTDIRFPAGTGYRVDAMDTWNLIYDLANMNTTATSVYIKMHYEWVPMSTPGMTNVEPIWMDLAQCGFSEIARPAGTSQASWGWWVNRPGRIIGIGGHIHDGGTNIVIRNESTGQVICDSRAGYGESPLYIDSHGMRHLSSMSKCMGTLSSPVATISNGQLITETAHYDMDEAVTDQMGIVMAFVAPPG